MVGSFFSVLRQDVAHSIVRFNFDNPGGVWILIDWRGVGQNQWPVETTNDSRNWGNDGPVSIF